MSNNPKHNKPPTALNNHEMKIWLRSTASLTRKLEARLRCKIKAEVLTEGYQNPADLLPNLESSANSVAVSNDPFVSAIRAHPHCKLWCREVILTDNYRPLVYAKTIIPQKTLARFSVLKSLENLPIGIVLYKLKPIKRVITALNYYESIEAISPLPDRIRALIKQAPESYASNGIWQRQSMFVIKNHPLLIQEIILPTLFNQPDRDPLV